MLKMGVRLTITAVVLVVVLVVIGVLLQGAQTSSAPAEYWNPMKAIIEYLASVLNGGVSP